VQDDFPLTRSKVIVRPVIMTSENASREDNVITAVKHVSFSSVAAAGFPANTQV